MKIKDDMYNFFVRRNPNIQREYETYVINHLDEHNLRRGSHWKILIRLNLHYAFNKNAKPLLDNTAQQLEIQQRVETKEEADIRKDKRQEENTRYAVLENFRVVANNGSVLKVEWNDIPDTVCYNVYYSTDKKNYKFVNQVNFGRCEIDKLRFNTEYYIKIKYSKNGKNFRDDLPVQIVKTRTINAYDLMYKNTRICVATSESEFKPIRTAMNFAKGLMPYDTISFDIFDTLIFRPFKNPYDIFVLVGTKLDIMDFCELRRNAEEEARQIAKQTRGNREVTIEEIYDIIERKTGVKKEVGIKTEFEVEIDLCYANPYMKQVYDLMRYQNKTIVLCSDMYLPAEMMEKLLNKNGYEGYDKIFVSCDYNCTKRDGKLYEYIKQKYSNIIHIGDNVKSDVEKAREAGISAVEYKNVNNKGNVFRADGMSYLIDSAYSGIVNAHLHNGTKHYTPYYEMGYIYAGLYVYGFCQWLHEKSKERKIDKILFLAREGDIYQKVFRQCFDDVETEYTLWSRVPVAKTIVRKNRHPFLLQLVHHKANAIYKTKITTLLERIGLASIKDYLEDYRLNVDEYLIPENEKVLEKLLVDHWDEVCRCYDNDLEKVKNYLKCIIKDNRNVAVVDVGWSGNNVLQIKYLVENVFKMDCKVSCFLAATRNVNDTYMAGMMQDKQVETYIFSNYYNKGLHDYHQSTNNRLNSFFFEIMTQSPTPTFLGFDEDRFVFDVPEIENYAHDKEIHEGILDFAKEYHEIFKNYPYMRNIPGNDAYMPFRLLSSNVDYYKKWFADFVFGRDLCATQENSTMETVGEVIEKARV